MDERMTLTEVHNRLQRMSVAIGLPNAGRRIKSDEVRWSEELRLLAAAVSAHLTQPAQAVDVEAACVSMYPDWQKFHQHERETFRKEMKQAITRAIGNAQAEGWKATEADVIAWRGRNDLEMCSLFDCQTAIEDARMMHHFKITPPTQATPNAHLSEPRT